MKKIAHILIWATMAVAWGTSVYAQDSTPTNSTTQSSVATQMHATNAQQTATTNSNTTTPAATADKVAAPSVIVTKVAATTFKLDIKNVPDTMQSVVVPTWSTVGGQDDIVWYTATKVGTGQYTLTVKASAHKQSVGDYISDVYGKDASGKLHYFTKGTFTMEKTTVPPSVSVTKVDATTFKLDIKNVPDTMQSVIVPTWSTVGGQDDIVWYTATKVGTGQYTLTVKASAHKQSMGDYISDVYGKDASGKLHYFTKGTFTMEKTTVPPSVSVTKVDATTFKLDIKNVPDTMQSVIVPTWSTVGGQDDIVWYTATKVGTGQYTLTVKASAHKQSMGEYISDVYGKDASGKLHYFTKGTFTMEKTTVPPSVSVTKVDATTFKLDIKNVPDTMQSVVVPTWSTVGGQDDIVWYTATKVGTGQYTLTVKASAHKQSMGDYISDVYGKDASGKLHYFTKGTFTMEKTTVPPSVSVTKVDATTFKLDIKNVPDTMQSVIVPTWSTVGGQDDVVWYTATKVNDTTYTLTVRTSHHSYSTGEYVSDVYVKSNTGTLQFISTQRITMTPVTLNRVVFLDPGHGGIDAGAAYYGVYEKNLALKMYELIRSQLEENQFTVLTSRSDDSYVDYKTERSRMANSTNADIFISLHFNATGAGTNTSVQGIETYWYEYDPNYPPVINEEYHNSPDRLEKSKYLAEAIQKNVVQETGATDRGVRRETFAVVRETKAPAVLVELGYLDNQNEVKKITTEDYQKKLATGIVKAVLEYYNQYQTP